MASFLDNAVERFSELTGKPEVFIGTEDEISKQVESFLKQNYDFIKQQETEPLDSNALPELIVENFDVEQIWQQIELQNEAFLAKSITDVSKLVVSKEHLLFNEVHDALDDVEEENALSHKEDEQVENSSSSSDDDDDEPLNLDEDTDGLDSDDLIENEDENKEDALSMPNKKYKPSAVDDQFFKLDEMEAFLQAEEKKVNDAEPDSGHDSEDDEDMEADDDDEDELDLFNPNALENNDTERGGLNNPKYKDFFTDQSEGSTKTKRNKYFEALDVEEDNEVDDEDSLSDDDPAGQPENPNVKSTLEERNERLQKKMEELENAAVSEKPWQLKGEITAANRPQNSLLEEVVDFDLSSRPAPVMTEEVSVQLEDIIRQRIKDKAFDSVERKAKPVETPLEYRKKLVLEQQKSKESLAQIYEKDFLAQQEALDPDAADKEEEEPQLHKDIKKMMHSLFTKLDALSNFHFSPKPVQPELKVVSNLPAISMEEVAPTATSDAALLAPEEIKSKAHGEVIGQSERTTTDKNRERRKKKAKQHMHATLHKKKEQLGLGNKYSKEKAKKMLDSVTKEKNVDKMDESLGSKALKSSTAFFTQLEDEVRTQIKSRTSLKKKKTKDIHSAKHLKL